ncbi:hypothetical protein CLAFUW4_09563 [Fulvia fulva]|uniref:Uncharacterized protein n=1 Tax=Passalora fulva TaxID=5499 RepID=A0A9Q8PFX0_PASFU|nr:uncharacterized protein CLAFUR5_09658 [Fulvia fulva]KAK4613956.1 hypothetical protein CLAFUR4_09569 [Fulvia fulva]KAK4615119.1 hypothetical protein CLAFUR0_09560 [Fulvia fulva]UJO21753.1 hypothetical protein CLAFUR5_09658 [Fulvia fulva]WPV20687.1 hypothetical protein CLAFUW4_09563 [Fulvia fulva]WPV34749.1 hypothetical protein CLAFUW7_09564 [Fulvia fulva]
MSLFAGHGHDPNTPRSQGTDDLMQTRSLKPQEHAHTYSGKDKIITTRILISADRNTPCCTNIVARFTIRDHGRIASKRLGELHSFTINKTIEPTSGSDQNTWRQKMLSIPEGYKGNLRTHSSEKDAIQDREKIMMLLHDKEGSPSPHLSTEQRELLTAEQVHYIDKIRLEKQYVGTGLGFHFTGPVVLSPAPMDVKDSEYDEGMKKLIESYKRSGFEVWVNPDFQLRGPIAVMGRSV